MSLYRIRYKNQPKYDEGPSDFLMHFGIKGQKWGIRRFQNEDRTLTEEGKKRYYNSERNNNKSDTDNSFSDSEKKKIISLAKSRNSKNYDRVQDELAKSPLLQKAAKDSNDAYDSYAKAQKELDKQEDQFYSDKKVYEKYLNKAVDIAMTEDWSKNWGSRKDIYDWYKYDDGDQGENSSIELYKRSPEGKKLSDAEDNARKAYRHFSETCKENIKKALGPEGDEIVNPGADYEWSVSRRLAWDVQRILENKHKTAAIPGALTGSKKSIK